MKQKIFSSILAFLFMVSSQKMYAPCTCPCELMIPVLIFGVGFFYSSIAGGIYSVHKYISSQSKKRTIISYNKRMQNVSTKYEDLLYTYNCLKNTKSDLNHEKKLHEALKNTISREKNYLKQLKSNIVNLSRTLKKMSFHKNKIKEKMKPNKYLYIAEYEELKSLIKEGKDMLQALKEVYQFIKNDSNTINL